MTIPHYLTANKSAILQELITLLQPYKEYIESAIPKIIDQLGIKTELRDACEYALMTPGKRFRPAIVAMVSEAIDPKKDVTHVALAVEFFHTASLIADDLPCMDNDDFRRGRPTVHKVYGDSVALLASFSLIAAAFDLIVKDISALKMDPQCASNAESIACIATKEAARANGILCLIGGQYLDLYPPEKLDKKFMYEVIEGKTSALFELSFALGWLYSGADIQKLDLVKEAAKHFGSAFQILDDIDDMQKDEVAGRKVNYALLFGKEEAKKAVQEHMRNYRQLLEKIHLTSTKLIHLGDIVSKLCELY